MHLTANATVGEEEEREHILDYPMIRAGLIVVYFLVFLFCFFGNLMVILVTTFHWRMRSVTKFCLSNLAVANFCVGIFCILQNLTLQLLSGWIFGKFLCKMYHFTTSLSHTASVLILVVISVERYMVVLHPLKCRQILTYQRLRLIIAGVWILSVLVSAPRLYTVNAKRHLFSRSKLSKKLQVICVPSTAYVETLKIADTVQFILLFLIPVVVMSVLYARVGLLLLRRDKYRGQFMSRRTSRPSTPSVSRSASSRRSTMRNIFRRRSSSSESQDTTEMAFVTSSVPALNLITTLPNNGNNSTERDEIPGSSGNNIESRPEPGALNNVPMRDSRLKRSSRVRRKWFKNKRAKPNPRPHKSVVKLLIAIVIVFAVCNLPFHLRKLYQNWAAKPHAESAFSEILVPLSFLMMYANCALNPFLYAFASKSFRVCLVDFVRCRLRKPNRASCN